MSKKQETIENADLSKEILVEDADLNKNVLAEDDTVSGEMLDVEPILNTEKERDDFYNERVSIVFPRPADEPYGASRTITHNGKNYQIIYDEPVLIPRKVALIIEDSIKNQRNVEKKIADTKTDVCLGEF